MMYHNSDKEKLKKVFPLSAAVENHINTAYRIIREEDMKEVTKIKRKWTMRRYMIVAFCTVFLTGTIIYAAWEGGVADRSSKMMTDDIAMDITFSGSYQTSPEHQAAVEWNNYTEEMWNNKEMYRIDSSETLEKFGTLDSIYGVKTEEMKEKLYSIVEKWDLKLHKERAFYKTYEELLTKMQLKSFIPGDKSSFCASIKPKIYSYPDGSFYYENMVYYNDNLTGFELQRTAKGVLDIVGMNLGDISEYEEWLYTNKYGDEVLLSWTKEKGIISYETEDFWILVNVMADYTDENMRILEEKWVGQPLPELELSKDALEDLADIFSFEALE